MILTALIPITGLLVVAVALYISEIMAARRRRQWELRVKAAQQIVDVAKAQYQMAPNYLNFSMLKTAQTMLVEVDNERS